MKQISLLIIAILMMNTAIAKQTYGSILPPGGRIVAGDLSKNEFFILAANAEPETNSSIIHKTTSTKNITKPKIFAAKPIKPADIDAVIPKIRFALKKTNTIEWNKQKFIVKPYVPDKLIALKQTKRRVHAKG